MTASLDTILTEASGDVPDTILLMRLIAQAATETDARDALARALAAEPAGQSRMRRLQDLWAGQPQAWRLIRTVLAEAVHDADTTTSDEALRSWAAVFDRLAAVAPEAGVALYALGDPALLAAATQEVVAMMDRLGVLDERADVLDLGCGIGRLTAALASRTRSVVGVDISAEMVAEALRRCAPCPNVRLLHGNGRDLGFAGDVSVDVVLAADVFPYLVLAGGNIAAGHIAEFGRVLRPRGTALILNYSYSGNADADARAVANAAAASGLTVERSGTRDLALWDATTFLLRKDAALSP